MRTITKTLSTLLLLGSTYAAADTFKYEVPYPSSNYSPTYPNLDLSGLEKLNITTTNSEFDPQQKLNRVEFIFPRASNLIVNNFTKEGSTYRAIVSGAWVYKSVLVEIEAPDPLSMDSPLSTRVYVIENQNNLNNTQAIGLQTLEASGNLIDVTPNALADREQLLVDNKTLILKLFQRPVRDIDGQGFKVSALWLGKGEKNFYIPAPFPLPEYHNYKTIGIKIETHTYPEGQEDHFISIHYTDQNGMQHETPLEPLRLYLNQAFPPTA